MSHSYVKIWVHAVFGTKHREPLILPDIKVQVHEMLVNQCKEMNCSLYAINSMPDHVHLLFLLNSQRNITEVLKKIKGVSSFEINQQNLIDGIFNWQVGYGAFSVSESVIDKVKKYIKNQELHHQDFTFQQEYNRFAELNGFIINS